MITPGTFNNLPFYAGDSFSLKMNWKDANGDLFPLLGYGGRFVLLLSPAQDIVLMEVDESNGVLMGNVTPNIRIFINKAVTTLVEVAPVCYFFEVTDLTNVTSRLLEGTVDFKDLVDR